MPPHAVVSKDGDNDADADDDMRVDKKLVVQLDGFSNGNPALDITPLATNCSSTFELKLPVISNGGQ